MTTEIRFGLVGAGAIAKAYAEAFGRCHDIRVVGVADTCHDAAVAMAETLGCLHFSSYEEMIATQTVDAAIVCTPPVTHPEICIWLLHRGIPVLCEKPLAIDAENAREMVAAADDSGITFTMASKFRYVEDVVKAKSLVEAGILGDVLAFENCFAGHVDMGARWNSNPAISGGGVLIDNGTHSVDIMRYFFGRLADIQVVEGKRHQNLEVEDTVRVMVRSAGGVIGNIDLSWSMNKEQPFFLSIYGSEGTMFVGWQESRYRRSGDKQWTRFGDGYDKIAAFQAQIANFTAAVRGQEPLRITSEDAIASVEVIEAAYSALRNSRWQEVMKNGDGGLGALAETAP